MGKIWAVCSGSGGVGKSMIALSLAAGAAKAGKGVILLDASGNARSCDLILGLESIVVLDMLDVIGEQIDINAALYPVRKYEGLRYACASLSDELPVSELSSITLALNSKCDILVLDLPTGQTNPGLGVMRSEDERIWITRPDDASVRSLERLMRSTDDDASSCLVINRISRDRIKRRQQHVRAAVESVLDCAAVGCIPEDPSIPISEQNGRAAIECDGPAWTDLKDLLQALLAGAL